MPARPGTRASALSALSATNLTFGSTRRRKVTLVPNFHHCQHQQHTPPTPTMTKIKKSPPPKNRDRVSVRVSVRVSASLSGSVYKSVVGPSVAEENQSSVEL